MMFPVSDQSRNDSVARHRGRIRLLLVEDSLLDAELVLGELEAGGFEVDSLRVENRADMESALDHGEWDVIISDFDLPEFNGMDALSLAKAKRIEVPFIIVSGAIGEETAVEIMRSGANDYLMKANLSRLVPAVVNAMRSVELKRLHYQAESDLKASREQLRLLASHLEEVREEERSRIARDLHDAIGTNLTAMKMDVHRLKRALDVSDDEMGYELQAITNLVDYSIVEVRRMINELRPSILDDLGLVAAIEWQLDMFSQRYDIEADLDVDPATGELLQLSRDISVAVFRMFQEALSNAGRHAGAARVGVRIRCCNNRLLLEISDDGKGFDVETESGHNSFGLMGMRERARAFGGHVHVQSSPGSGTRLLVDMPVTCS